MSTPRHPHHLRRGEFDEAEAYFTDGGKAGLYVPQLYSQMHCDGAMGRCRLPPARGLMIIIPPRPFTLDLAVTPRRVFTTLHYCERHIATEAGKVTPVDMLDDRMKRQIERVCKSKWPQEYTPDFDRATFKWELVTTPEYRKFLERLEQRGRLVSKEGIPLL